MADPRRLRVWQRIRDPQAGAAGDWGFEIQSRHTNSNAAGSAVIARDPVSRETCGMSEHLTPERILQTGLAFWGSKTLLSAIELGVFTELAHGPRKFDTLYGRLGLHERSARDFLDTLVALAFLRREGDVYSNTAETDRFLDQRKPSYVGGFLEM